MGQAWYRLLLILLLSFSVDAQGYIKTLEFNDDFYDSKPSLNWARIKAAESISAKDLTFCFSMSLNIFYAHHLFDSMNNIM